jgi:glycosyltransferase involved in cell wall biosynthesis
MFDVKQSSDNLFLLVSNLQTVQLIVGSQNGGAETAFVRVGIALSKRGYAQHLVLSPHTERQRLLTEAGVPHTVIDFETLKGIPGRVQFGSLIRKLKPDLTVAWMNRAARRLSSGPHKLIGRIGGPYDFAKYKHCDWIIVNSQPLLEQAHAANFHNVTLIPNFVVDVEQTPIKEKNPGKFLLAAGRLHYQKGFDILIQSMKNIDCELRIAGEGDGRHELEQLARIEGVEEKVTFLGWRNDMKQLIASARLIVFPSRHEGMSNFLLESMAAGKPIVASNGEGVSCFLHDSVDSLIVPVNDPDALSMAINRLLKAPPLAMRLGNAARKNFLEHFTEDAACNAWISLFSRLHANPN